jgi:putative FmdB family regulatory protein
MPSYDYKCTECRRVFALMRRREIRGARAECPDCGASKGKRLFTTAGLLRAGKADSEPASQPSREVGAGFVVRSGNNTFIDCVSSFNKGPGFVFEGRGRNVMVNTQTHGNPIGIIVRGGAQIRDYNTDIQ